LTNNSTAANSITKALLPIAATFVKLGLLVASGAFASVIGCGLACGEGVVLFVEVVGLVVVATAAGEDDVVGDVVADGLGDGFVMGVAGGGEAGGGVGAGVGVGDGGGGDGDGAGAFTVTAPVPFMQPLLGQLA
jgi:hypothetical protein